jgi:hypothetical protein
MSLHVCVCGGGSGYVGVGVCGAGGKGGARVHVCMRLRVCEWVHAFIGMCVFMYMGL